MMLILNYCIFLRSAEALVRCGGKLEQLLIADFLSNICDKHYENPTVLCFLKLQLKMSGMFSETHCLRHTVETHACIILFFNIVASETSKKTVNYYTDGQQMVIRCVAKTVFAILH